MKRVLAEALILETSGLVGEAAALLADSIKRELVAGTGRADGFTHGGSESRIVSRVLAQLPDAAAWFDRLWRETYDSRERFQFFRHRNLDNPAYPAIAWALQALNCTWTAETVQLQLTERCLNALIETRMTDFSAGLPSGEMERLTLIAGMIVTALASQGRAPQGCLERYLAEIFSPAPDFAFKMARLMASEISPTIIAAAKSVGAERVKEALHRAIARDTDGAARLLTAEDVQRLELFLTLLHNEPANA